MINFTGASDTLFILSKVRIVPASKSLFWKLKSKSYSNIHGECASHLGILRVSASVQPPPHTHNYVQMSDLDDATTGTEHHTDDRHSSASKHFIILFHKTALLKHEVMWFSWWWLCAVKVSGSHIWLYDTNTPAGERSPSNHNIHISHSLSCLPAVCACISGIAVTIVTDWARAYACIHPNEMINTHLTHVFFGCYAGWCLVAEW